LVDDAYCAAHNADTGATMNGGTIVQALQADAEYREVHGLEPLDPQVVAEISTQTLSDESAGPNAYRVLTNGR